MNEILQARSSTCEVLTIGHSTLSYEDFLKLLRDASVTAVADVRSAPYSRHYPHFNRETLKRALDADGIKYSFLGEELGGRPKDRRLFFDGVANYERMAREPSFMKGLDRVIEGARKYRVALMCSERDPLDCHRCLLVSCALAQREVRVSHILGDGSIASHDKIEDRLLEFAGRNDEDLFAPRSERLAAAYRERASKVAFAEPEPDPRSPMAAE